MKLKKYLSSFLLFLLLSQLAFSSEVKKKCGNYLFVVRMLSWSDIYDKKFELYYFVKGHMKLIYKTNSVFSLDVACIKNRNEDFLLLFSEFYGGNAGPEDVYGIFDPRANKLLIKPADNGYKDNFNETKKILGFSPPQSSDDADVFFCCLPNGSK